MSVPSCAQVLRAFQARSGSNDCLEGRSDALFEKFFRLHVLTRRKHGLPPQPLVWFRNLIIVFKDHWGTSRTTLTYHRYPATRHQNSDERLLTGLLNRPLATFRIVC